MGSLGFLRPEYLWAALLIAVPIIIHLIYRRRAIKWRFAAFEFLLRSYKRVERRLKLKQLLLLLLRIAIALFLALAFARPFIKRGGDDKLIKPRAIVVIVDTSMSMRYREGTKTLFDRARKKAVQFIDSLRREDRIALLSTSESQMPNRQQRELTFDKSQVIKKLKRWRPSFAREDLRSAISKAISILRDEKNSTRQIAIFSDLSKHSVGREPGFLSQKPPGISIEFIAIRPKKNVKNTAITKIELQPAPFAGANAYQLTAFIRNFSPKKVQNLPIKIVIGKKTKIRGFVSIEPYGETAKSFILRLKSQGKFEGKVVLSDTSVKVNKRELLFKSPSILDNLLEDNTYYFAFKTLKRPRILLVSGELRTIPYLDELFYLEKALRDTTSPFIVRSVRLGTALPDPNGYSAVFLANVPTLPQNWRKKLLKFVYNGGGLFISMGDQIDPLQYNREFREILPRELRHSALAAQRPDGQGVAVQRYFGEVKAEHPIFSNLYSEGFVFQSARIIRLMLVEPRKPGETGEVIWRYSHGPPALLETPYGKGRILLLTTTIDRDWTDLPIRPFFAPWIREVASYLSGGIQFKLSPNISVNESFILPPSWKIEPPAVAVSNWHDTPLPLEAEPNGKLLFNKSSIPGMYEIKSLKDYKNKKKSYTITVNYPTSESDLTPIPDRELSAIGTLSQESSFTAIKYSERLWPFLFGFLILFFLLEASILRWM